MFCIIYCSAEKGYGRGIVDKEEDMRLSPPNLAKMVIVMSVSQKGDSVQILYFQQPA